MKKIDLKQYLMWMISFILSIFLFNISQGNSNIILTIIWVVISVSLFNLSWIFFYKVLKTKIELWKILFSFLNISVFSTIVLTTIFK